MTGSREFTVEMEIMRHVTVVISADSVLEARNKANNLDFAHEIVGEITFWNVLEIQDKNQEICGDMAYT